jgi:hypothetical protein
MKNPITKNLLFRILLILILSSSHVSGLSPGFKIKLINGSQKWASVGDGQGTYNARLNQCTMPVGSPDIPALSALILIPNGAELSVSCTPGQPEVYYEGYVNPVPPHMTENNTNPIPPPGDYINNQIYGSAELYPRLFFEIKRLGKIRGQEAAILFIYPYKYDPLNREIVFYSNLSLTVQYGSNNSGLPWNLLFEYDPDKPPHPIADALRTSALNFNQVVKLEMAANKPSDVVPVPGCNFIIITRDDLKPAADKLAVFKNSQGINTIIQSYPGIIAESTVESYI